MKILVTGATGFVGNKVIEQLIEQGHTVIATSTNLGKAQTKNWFNKVKYIPYTINASDKSNLFDLFQKPDVLIHLAWKGLPNYKELFHVEENLWDNYFFLKNLISNGLKNVTVIGTCFEYGFQESCLSENLETKPANSYALAKDTLRKFVEELNKKYDFSFKWVRLFYMYGEGQSPKSLISQLHQALENGEEYFNMSKGDQIRDYLPIEKVAKNIALISTQNNILGIINCCSGAPITVKQFTENYLNQINQTIKLNLGYYPYSDLEPFAFWGDNNKLKKISCIKN